mmetsp:Transcript_23191/g.38861  ORF Transcript_23191/g.38861 Transcript_23191/m.38861 type:complete len:265 (+) Transcript_23191:136-930(+)
MFLAATELAGLRVRLCLNKSDLVSEDVQEEWQQRFADWGYPPYFVSAKTDPGLGGLVDFLAEGAPTNAITVIVGPSGVGKSSIINRLLPSLNLRTAEVSGKLRRGRHTTRHVQLFEVIAPSYKSEDGNPARLLLADTPGFNRPSVECEPEQLGSYFPEIVQRLSQSSCQFADCVHRPDDPGCCVAGEWERYDYYLDLLDDVESVHIAQETREIAGKERRESTEKMIMKKGGRVQMEPRLDRRRFRSAARNTTKQKMRNVDLDEM